MSAPAKQLDVPVTGEHRVPAPGAGEAWWKRADLLVVAGAALLLTVGWLTHRALTRPRMVPFQSGALSLSYPAEFALRDPLVAPRDPPARVTLRKPGDALARIDVAVEKRRAMLGDAAAGRELARAQRYGAHYDRRETARKHVNGRDWQRTRFRYVSSESGTIAIVHAVEYVYPTDPSVRSDESYVVTVHGTEAGVGALEASVLRSLRVR